MYHIMYYDAILCDAYIYVYIYFYMLALGDIA